ncbi:hypothetical protein ABB27_13080 [Stenotrophomonas terrae]|uniref:ABM domain-containing protein n=1 Tax=Stenotrophomonas terrae TaxID=405446 RepID=A0A0R0CBW1_9GAMM|nr:antibiotic biosynthesis monooxygenase [Stenotrophomonas terrae]KRG66640.1 hypothetical protein ABB27_13080 [Stenotrophomonas terrae]
MSELFINVVLYAKQGREQQLHDALKVVVDASRKEQGALRYDLYRDQADPRRFIFVEHWASHELREKHHHHGPHIKYFEAHHADAVERTEAAYFMDLVK